MVGIVNYGVGNIYSVISIVKYLGKEVLLVKSAEDIKKVKFLILPGVGNFKAGMEFLEKTNLKLKIKEKILSGTPTLGICLGLQILFEWSEEGGYEGFGILKGKVVKFKNKGLKIPHMCWNRVKFIKKNAIFENLKNNSFFYFAHSYYVVPEEKIAYGLTNYGKDFVSIIIKENIVGVQFHPEKSEKNGLIFMKNFLEEQWVQ